MVYGYSAGSRYASLLQPYLELFSPEDFFFVFQDDLKSRANETCKEIFEFLGIESSIQISTSNSNPAAMPRSRRLAQDPQATFPVQGVSSSLSYR